MRALLVALVVLVAPPLAQGKKVPQLGGTYTVTWTTFGNTCGDYGLVLTKDEVVLTQRGKTLTVSVPLVHIMKGSVRDTGAFEVLTKKVKSGVEGLKGQYQMTGTVVDDKLEVTFVARYYQGNTRHCEQSWTGNGPKK